MSDWERWAQTQLTVVTCSYETPEALVAMLQSYACHHPGTHRLCVVENSRDEITRDLLREHDIPYFANPGGTHSPSVDIGLSLVRTRYALLVDTDVLFLRSVLPLFERLRSGGFALMGDVQGSRGGYNLHPRVAPYCCFLDVQALRLRGLRYHDPHRVARTGSDGFFANPPMQKNEGRWYYDVGSTLHEDCLAHGLRVGTVTDELPQYVVHFEGLSWHEKSGHPVYVQAAEAAWRRHRAAAMPFREIPLKGRFA